MNRDQQQNIQAMIRRLTTAAATAALYNLQHQQVAFLCDQALEHFRAALAEQEELSLLLIDDDLICGNSPLERDMATERLTKMMIQRGIGHLKLRQGLMVEELHCLVDLLSKKAIKDVKISSSPHLRYGKVEVRSNAGDSEEVADILQQFPSLAELESDEMARFMELHQDIRAGRRLNVRGINEIVGNFVHALSEQGESLLALSPLRDLDEYTYTHSTNVCILNIAQAQLLGIEGQLLHDIGTAAMLHDIGKLFVPQEVLQKPGKLDQKEWQIIQSHPQLGAEYLVNTPGVPRLAVITAYEHHMRFDGTGYPRVAKKWQQHLCSQITTISDFYDALRTHRSYRAGMDFAKISAIMLEEAGTALHPLLVRNFLAALQRLDDTAQAVPLSH